MEYLLLVMALPVLWPFVAKALWGNEITLQELALNVLIAGLLSAAVYQAGKFYQTADSEILNGEVLSKASERVSCSHSYRCNCRETCTGSGSSRSCSTTCDTCHEHGYDVDWVLKTSVGNITIDRVDRQGIHEPARFSRATKGDPVAKTHLFTNYVKGAPESLFNTDKGGAAERYLSTVPAYPLAVYDYHYVNRAVSVGVQVPDLTEWNRDLAVMLKRVGPAKEANVVVLFVNNPDPNYAESVRKAWLGGKKNDVIVVLGAPEYPKLSWARVVSWTDVELFKVQLRDALLDQEQIVRPAVLGVIEQSIMSSFKRKSMKDFEYLKSEIAPPTWVIAAAVLLGLVASVVLSLYFAEKLGSTRYQGRPGVRRSNFRIR